MVARAGIGGGSESGARDAERTVASVGRALARARGVGGLVARGEECTVAGARGGRTACVGAKVTDAEQGMGAVEGVAT